MTTSAIEELLSYNTALYEDDDNASRFNVKGKTYMARIQPANSRTLSLAKGFKNVKDAIPTEYVLSVYSDDGNYIPYSKKAEIQEIYQIPRSKLLTEGFGLYVPNGSNEAMLKVFYPAINKIMTNTSAELLDGLIDDDSNIETASTIADMLVNPATDSAIRNEIIEHTLDPASYALLLAVKESYDSNALQLREIKQVLEESADNTSGLNNILDSIKNPSDAQRIQEKISRIPGLKEKLLTLSAKNIAKTGELDNDTYSKLSGLTTQSYGTDHAYVVDKTKRPPIAAKMYRRSN